MAKTIDITLQENTSNSDLVTKSTAPDTLHAAAASDNLLAIQYTHANVNIADPAFRGYKITNIS